MAKGGETLPLWVLSFKTVMYWREKRYIITYHFLGYWYEFVMMV